MQLLDERSKQYSSAGDDSINENVAHLVRGTLAPTIKQVLEHGMKKASILGRLLIYGFIYLLLYNVSYTLLGTTCHPWLFIEEAASKEVEKDFASVYSRLILCKTFRLDEDGKVLTPEEVWSQMIPYVLENYFHKYWFFTSLKLLYRCVQAVNISHDVVHAQMDVKLRSLICMGLNEQVLHLWLEVLGSSINTIQKWCDNNLVLHLFL